jgi:hypothetical protein
MFDEIDNVRVFPGAFSPPQKDQKDRELPDMLARLADAREALDRAQEVKSSIPQQNREATETLVERRAEFNELLVEVMNQGFGTEEIMAVAQRSRARLYQIKNLVEKHHAETPDAEILDLSTVNVTTE